MRAILSLSFLFVCTVPGIAWSDPPQTIKNWQIKTPDIEGDVSGTFTLPITATTTTANAGDSTGRLATTEFVTRAVVGGQSTASYCALTGCTFVNPDDSSVTVSVQPWNYEGYHALAIGGALTFRQPDGSNVGLLSYEQPNSTYPGLIVRGGSLYVDRALFINAVATPASSTAPCFQGQIEVDGGYLYYCIASGNWGRIAWSTSW